MVRCGVCVVVMVRETEESESAKGGPCVPVCR